MGTLQRAELALKRLRTDPAFFAEKVAGLRLNRAQRRMLLLGGRVRVRVAGRRFGKTTLTALDLLHLAITRPGSRCLVLGPSLEQAKIYFERFLEWRRCPLVEFLWEGLRMTPRPQLVLRNGSTVRGGSAGRPDFLRGRGYDILVVTEASWVPDAVFWSVARPMLIENKSSFVLVEGTPWTKESFLYSLFVKGLRALGPYRSAHATSFEAPHLSREEMEALREEMPERVFETEILAEFPDEGGLFPRELILSATEDYKVPMKPAPGGAYCMGVDLAKKRDYAVIIVLDITKIPWKIAYIKRFRGVKYTALAATVRELGRSFGAKIVIDQTGVGEAVIDMIPGAKGVVITQRTRENLLMSLALALERGDLKIPSSPDVIAKELRHFGDPGWHDDTVFALALAVWGARASGRGWEAWRAKDSYF